MKRPKNRSRYSFQERCSTKLKYIDEDIPSAPGMFPFECLEELEEGSKRNQMIAALIEGQKFDHDVLMDLFETLAGHPFVEATDEDCDGDEIGNGPNKRGLRVKWYLELVKISSTVCGMKRYLTSRPVRSAATGSRAETTDAVIQEDGDDSNNALASEGGGTVSKISPWHVGGGRGLRSAHAPGRRPDHEHPAGAGQ